MNIIEESLQEHKTDSDYTEMKLFSPLKANYYDKTDEEDYNECYVYELDPQELVHYKDAILTQIDEYGLPNERGLMEYCRDDSLSAKVQSALPTVEEHHGKLWGVLKCELKEPLSHAEIENLKEYWNFQAKDRYGESFEQREIEVGDITLYVHFWSGDKDYFVCTEKEFDTMHTFKRAKEQQRNNVREDAR